MKFFVVDMQQILDESKIGKAASDLLEASWGEAEKAFAALQVRAEEAQNKGDDAEAERLLIDAGKVEQEANERLADHRQSLCGAVVEKAQQILKVLCEERGADVILDQESVAYVDPSLNITDEVVARLDSLEPPAGTKV